MRSKDDPFPTELMMKMMNIPYSNIKTQLCKYWQTEGKCKYRVNCSYAHGPEELRKPYEPLPYDIAQKVQNQTTEN